MTLYTPADLERAIQAQRDDWAVKDAVEAADRRMTERYESIQRQLDEFAARQRQLLFGAPEAQAEPEAEVPVAESAPEPEAEADETEADGPALISEEFVRGLSAADYARYRSELGPGRARASSRGILG